MPDNKKMVEIRHFKMSFGDKTVIKDLSFDVFRGEVFGFLGSNGSGKTTTLRALLGLYQPTAGDLLINGKPYSVESQIRLGYLPEERGLYKKEKVLDVMLYFGQLKGLSRKEAKDFSLKFFLPNQPLFSFTSIFAPFSEPHQAVISVLGAKVIPGLDGKARSSLLFSVKISSPAGSILTEKPCIP